MTVAKQLQWVQCDRETWSALIQSWSMRSVSVLNSCCCGFLHIKKRMIISALLWQKHVRGNWFSNKNLTQSTIHPFFYGCKVLFKTVDSRASALARDLQ